MPDIIGCYLLRSDSKVYKGATYIGFTTDPRRRIRQHNGDLVNGAWQTKRKRPWSMMVYVHGFPNKRVGLQFEWAWQNPRRSRFLKRIYAGKRPPYGVKGKLQILHEMLNVLPWKKYPLHVNFITQEAVDIANKKCRKLPSHIDSILGPLDALHIYQKTDYKEEDTDSEAEADLLDELEPELSQASDSESVTSISEAQCQLCNRLQSKLKIVTCIYCNTATHIVCLARKFRLAALHEGKGDLIPESGKCPRCTKKLLWPTVVEAYLEQSRKRKRVLKRKKNRSRSRSRSRSCSSQQSSRRRRRAATD
mmetsp:Transcript_3978/g.5872  ORF Transcript_3978/g.5872 Transcript_3978/m.5872 type:complete len:307 (+) Transcript_3978:235-1155(+)